VAIDCDHPRPRLNLPGYVPRRMAWQVPSLIPGIPPEAARVIQQALGGVYQELGRLGMTRNVIPLAEDLWVQPGSVVRGVGSGQTVTLLPPGALGYLDPVSLQLTDVSEPVTVVHPDGSTTSIGSPGAYDFLPAGGDDYETSPATSVLAGSVPTDTLIGRDSAGTGPIEFISVTGGLEFSGAGSIRIADDGVTNAMLRNSAGLTVIGRSTNTTGDPADIGPATQSSTFLRVNTVNLTPGGVGSGTAPTSILWSSIFPADLPRVQDGQMYMNVLGAFSAPLARNVSALAGPGLLYSPSPAYRLEVRPSTSVVIDAGTGEVQRAALTGDITAPQNDNATAFRSFTALSVLGRSANSAGLPADITAVAASGAVLRESGSVIGFGTIATAGLADDSVTDGKLRDSVGLSVIGRSANSTGDPADIVAGTDGHVLRRSGTTLGFGTVATAGITDDAVTNAKLAEMTANTVKANATASTANPTDFAVGTNTVLGRVAGNIVAAQLVNAQITDGTIANAKLANMADATAKGRALGAGAGVPTDLTGAQVGAITRFAGFQGGAVAAGTYNDYPIADGTKQVDIDPTGGNVEFTGFALGTSNTGGWFVLAKFGAGDQVIIKHNNAGSAAANRIFTPNGVDYIMATQLDTVLIVNMNGRWQVVDRLNQAASITNAMLANMAAGRIKGVQVDGVSGPPVDLTGAEVGENLRRETHVVDSLSSGTITTYVVANITTQVNFKLNVDITIHGLTSTSATFGKLLVLNFDAGFTGSVTLVHESGSAAGSLERIRCPGGANLTIRANDIIVLEMFDSRWRVISVAKANNVTDGDKGDITVSSGGATWTIDANAITTAKILDANVTDAKIANRQALSLFGRSVNSAGVGADITSISGSDSVMRESGGTINWGTVATAGIANSAITTAKILDANVTDAKISNRTALSVFGRSANSAGVGADIAAVAASGAVLRESGSALGFGTIATAGLANGAVTLAKMADLAQSTIIGRAEGAGTGVPTALTPAQVISIIDQQAVTWTANHAFNSTLFDVTTTSNLTLSAGTTLTLAAASTVTVASPMIVSNAARFDSYLHFGSTTGLPASGDIRKGTVSALSIQSAVDVDIGAADDISLTATDTVAVSAGTNVTLAATADVSLSAGDDISLLATDEITASAQTVTVTAENIVLSSGALCFADVVGSVTATENNFSVAGANVARFNGTSLLTGMVPSRAGQLCLIVNAHVSTILEIGNEHAGSSAANRFALDTTSRWVMDGAFALAWYDGTDSRWRLLSPDRTTVL
jgi:hypothetical protein